MKAGFEPISIDEYVEMALANNPAYTREQIINPLRGALRAYKKDIRCHCGNEIWVIGSASVGWYGCFNHIEGKPFPEGEYEIDEAL